MPAMAGRAPGSRPNEFERVTAVSPFVPFVDQSPVAARPGFYGPFTGVWDVSAQPHLPEVSCGQWTRRVGDNVGVVETFSDLDRNGPVADFAFAALFSPISRLSLLCIPHADMRGLSRI